MSADFEVLSKADLNALWTKIKNTFATKDVATTTTAGLMSAADKTALDNISAGTVTSIKVGSTTYNPSSGVVSLPEYLPVSGGDVDYLGVGGSSSMPLTVIGTAAEGAGILFTDSTQPIGAIGVTPAGVLQYVVNDNPYDIIHSGNISSQSVNHAASADSADSVAWSNVSSKPTKLSQFTDDLGSSPTHTHSQYALGANLGTAAAHAHGDYVTGISWDSTNGKLAWSKGGTAQTAITVGYATSAGSAPASDVYPWAKQSTKPSYSFSEITGTVSSSQLPSYVDDVLEYASKSNFPATGESGKIYVALDTNLTWRWSGSVYVEISPSLALGETSSTAYRGDRGKTAYNHATDSSRLTTATASGFYKIAVTAEGHVASVTAVAKSDITALGIPGSDTTYSAGSGLSLSGTTFNHSNSVTAQTTQALYPIKIDAQGHISAYGSAVTSLPASDVSSWAKASSLSIGLTTSSVSSYTQLQAATQYAFYAGGSTIYFCTPQDTNTWRPLGTGANDACAGNDSRLSDARPASDVYSWAKAANKPSYNFGEISSGTISQGDGAGCYIYRQNSDLEAGFYYNNAGDESVVFANNYEGAGWIFTNGVKPSTHTDWKSVTPTLQIKRGGVVIGKLIGQGATPSYNLDVNGSINGTSIYLNGTALATVATSGSYNDLSNKPTIPSVSNATITIKQTGISDQTFTLNGSATTITLADTNTWRPLGTGASDACAGNDSRLSDARPASDVYSWAKAQSFALSITSGSSPSPTGLAFGTQYALNAGGSAIYFTMPALGTTGTTACAGNDSRLSDARPASDVSSWAKASSLSIGLTTSSVSSYTQLQAATQYAFYAGGSTIYFCTPQDTNTWRPLGTGANDACAGNDSRLSDARPASDVYSWAKASSKPSYAFSEITGTVTNAQLAGSIANNKLANSSVSIAGTSVSLGGSISASTLQSNLGLGGAAYKAVVTSVDTSASLPTSNAVKTFVEGKGYVTSSGVTSVATGTGLTGGTITGTGTISINSAYQTYISHGESAYNSLSSYLPLSGGDVDYLGVGGGSVSMPLTVIGAADAGAGILFTDSTQPIGAIGVTLAGVLQYVVNDNPYDVIHTGNKGNYTFNPSSHTHGNIQNGGTLQSSDIAIASGDKLVVTDSSDSSKIARTSLSFDGSTITKALTKKGTFESIQPALVMGSSTQSQTYALNGTGSPTLSAQNVGGTLTFTAPSPANVTLWGVWQYLAAAQCNGFNTPSTSTGWQSFPASGSTIFFPTEGDYVIRYIFLKSGNNNLLVFDAGCPLIVD